MMPYYVDKNDQLVWLLTEPQLRAYLDERGVVMRSDVPANGQWRGKPLYDPKAALSLRNATRSRMVDLVQPRRRRFLSLHFLFQDLTQYQE